MSKNHKCEAVETKGPYCFSHPVATREEFVNRAAHGGILWKSVCECGKERHTLENGRHVEVGPWFRPRPVLTYREKIAAAYNVRENQVRQDMDLTTWLGLDDGREVVVGSSLQNAAERLRTSDADVIRAAIAA